MTLVAQENAELSALPGLERYSCAVVGGVLHILTMHDPAGNVMSVASSFAPSGPSASELNTAITTAGNGVLTAAGLFGGLITRSGPSGAFTDTTDTAAALQAIWAGSVGSSFAFSVKNTAAFAETLAGGTGVTLSGQTVIPALSVGNFLAVWTGTNTITVYGVSITALAQLPGAQLSTTLNQTTGSLPAGAITGGRSNYLFSTNATPGAQLVRTAAQMLADTPNGQVGDTWAFRIINTGAGTLTLTTDGGGTVTLSGTMTVAQNKWRDFVGHFDTPTTATITAVGDGSYT